MEKQKEPAPLGLSMAKAIMIVAIIASLGIVLGVAVKNKQVVNQEPKVSVTPDVDNDISDWQIYKNEEFGIEFKYPNDWSVSEKYNTITINSKNDIQKFEILKSSGPPPETMDMEPIKNENVMIGDVSASKSIMKGKFETNKNNYYLRAVISGKEIIYHAGFTEDNYKKYSPVFDQILSTFKFTEKDETADWKTYRNEEYGFEFEYPLNYKINEKREGIEIFIETKKGKWSIKIDFAEGYNLSSEMGASTFDELATDLIHKYYCFYHIEKYDITCTNNIEKKEFINKYGIKGLEFNIEEVIEYTYLGDKTTRIKEPIFVLDLDKQEDNIVKPIILDFNDRNGVLGEKERNNIINQILSSFKFIEKDEIADWKIYTSDKYGFSFKYPSDWNVLGNIADNEAAGANDSTISVWDPQTKMLAPIIYKDSENNIETVISREKSGLNNPIQESIIIGGVSAIKISGVILEGNMGAGESRNLYILNNDGTILRIDVDSGNSRLPLVNQILSTFKFIEK